TQMDVFSGYDTDPVSLHKYLYANGSPINGRDPSGYATVADMSAASDIQGILSAVRYVENLYRIYNRVNSAIDLVMGIRRALMMFDGDLTASIPRMFPPKVDFDEVGREFVSGASRAMNEGMPYWIPGYVGDYGLGKRFNSYVIYLPVLVPQKSSLVNSGVKINGKAVKIGLGGPGEARGSLAGIGVVMGGVEKQLFRMDIGLTPPGHKIGKGYEINAFDQPPFSFHVYDWHGGPR
ncbi:MAG: hypothetical protein KF800_07615, partial [Lysobacter sp.]|nr:hypothetical protein [Lysobacter sp.]